jgi:uncharacterized protein with HEPN domain
MRDAAREALAFVSGKDRSDLDTDRQLVLALAKCIEIIGEAASRISAETRGRCADIPWPQITGMRNRLIHAYYDIDLNILWDTVNCNLPPLAAALERAISAGPAD